MQNHIFFVKVNHTFCLRVEVEVIQIEDLPRAMPISQLAPIAESC